MSLMILIILASGVFLVGGVAPKMHDDTLNMASTGVVEGVKSDGVSGSSFAAAPGTNNESKKSLQMKQLILTTTTPTPVGPTRTPTPTTGSESDDETWNLSYSKVGCENFGSGQEGEKGTIVANGTLSGYISIEVNRNGSFSQTGSSVFVPLQNSYTIKLTNSEGFSSSPWRVRIFSGGSFNRDTKNWSGGTFRALIDNDTTSC